MEITKDMKIEVVRASDLTPGSLVVLSIPDVSSAQQSIEMQHTLQAHLPAGVEAVVLTGGARITDVLKRGG